MVKRKTTDEFRNEIRSLGEAEYTVLGEYINSHTKIEMRHDQCGFVYSVVPNSFIQGTRCPKCRGTVKKTTKEFKKEVYELVGDDYEVLGEYVNAKIKILMKHNKCNHEWEILRNKFLHGRRCPKCFGKLKKTDEIFKEEVKKLSKDEYSVLGQYINDSTKIEMRHNKCGYKYRILPSSFLSGRRCPKCAGNIKRTLSEFKEKVYSLVKNEYLVIGDYISTHHKITMRHAKCNSDWNVTPNSFLRGARCLKCSDIEKGIKSRKTHDVFVKEIEDLFEGEYILKEGSTYVTCKRYVTIIHNVCGNEYKVLPTNILKRRGCPHCSNMMNSKGVQAIKEYLDNNGLDYEEEFKFDDCRNKYPLRFDIFLQSKNLVIEFDGQFHFHNKLNNESLLGTQENDKIKNQYCINKNINLIRIPYWEKDSIRTIMDSIVDVFIRKNDDVNLIKDYYVNDSKWNCEKYYDNGRARGY
jgi:hypothetical protein